MRVTLIESYRKKGISYNSSKLCIIYSYKKTCIKCLFMQLHILQ